MLDPVTAATAPSPYPFYGALVANRPLYFDDHLGLWVASGAGMVSQILDTSAFRVRPPEQPVPEALAGTRAGEIFGRLVRMRDGDRQAPLKRAVCKALNLNALAPVDEKRLTSRSMAWAEHLLRLRTSEESGRSLPDVSLRLPIYSLGSLLGVASDQLPLLTLWMDDFVRCIAPGANEEQMVRAIAAADSLWNLFENLLKQAQFPSYCNPRGRPLDHGLLTGFARAACRHAGHDESLIVANAIGFLFQSYEATAGLIGNTLVALKENPALLRDVREDPARLTAVLREVLRFDPPIQNTRRFLAEDCDIGGWKMRAGDAVLLLLAAANRDPTANALPDVFDPLRVNPEIFTFGAGAHLCPGAGIAVAMAKGAVQQLLESGIDLDALTEDLRYRASQNARVPILNWRTS